MSEEGRPLRYALIPTKGNRRENLDRLLERLLEEHVQPIVIDTSPGGFQYFAEGGDAPTDFETLYLWTRPEFPVLLPKNLDINISAWWNLGLEEAEVQANTCNPERAALCGWDVAVLNDDCLPPAGWFDAVSVAMRAVGSVAGCSGHRSHTARMAGPISLWDRMTGFAFMVRGESGIRAEEGLLWYYTDDHIDWTARAMGGMTMIGTHPVEHLHPNGQMTTELHVQTGFDRKRFIELWGRAPW